MADCIKKIMDLVKMCMGKAEDFKDDFDDIKGEIGNIKDDIKDTIDEAKDIKENITDTVT